MQLILQKVYLRILGSLEFDKNLVRFFFVVADDAEMQKKQGVLVMAWEVKLLLRKKKISM